MFDNPLWTTWWAWVAAGLVLAILETLIPGYIFLGFAVGAVVMGLALATGLLPITATWAILLFAVLSLLAYLFFRFRLKSGRGEVKIIREDINEN